MPEFTATVHLARQNPVHRTTRTFEFFADDLVDAEQEVQRAARYPGYSAYHVTEVVSLELVA